MISLISRAILLVSLLCFVAGMASAGFAPKYLIMLANHSSQLAEQNLLPFAVGFTVCFIAVITLGLPGGAIMSILCGYYFGATTGSALGLFSTTFGAFIIWWVLRHARMPIAPSIFIKQRQALIAIIDQYPLVASLIVRMIPILPFYIVSVLLSSSGIRLRIYLLATAIGGIPSTVALVIIGSELHSVVSSQTISLTTLLASPMFFLPALALVLLTLTAVAAKKKFERG